MIAVAVFVSLLGCSLLSLGLPRYYQDVFGRSLHPARARLLRGGGWALVAAHLALCIIVHGWSQGPIFWASTLMLGAIAWVLLMTICAPRRGRA